MDQKEFDVIHFRTNESHNYKTKIDQIWKLSCLNSNYAIQC